MTIDEVAKLGKDCLIEYEGRLNNVQGVRPFTRDAKPIQEPMEKPFAVSEAETIRQKIHLVLERLASSGECCICEPETPSAGVDSRTVDHKNFRLTFTTGFKIHEYTPHSWIACWTLPPNHLF